MNDTEKPELTEAQRAELDAKEKAIKEHRRTLKDLRILSSVLLVVLGVNVLTIAAPSVTVGTALGVFACIVVSEHYRRKGPKK